MNPESSRIKKLLYLDTLIKMDAFFREAAAEFLFGVYLYGDAASNLVLKNTYDSLGRCTSVENPDRGLIEYFYDISGNLVKKLDGNLRKKPHGIIYTYEYNRLIKIDYPDKEDVTYSYGGSNAANAAGRLLEVQDESGVINYTYGKLGETTKIDKTLNRLMPKRDPVSFSFTYTFDYLGRMEKIIYPDGEELVYGYDHGGQITSVTGRHRDIDFEYVKQTGYDEFGQRVFIEYGNGVKTHYSYDEKRRWLKNLKTSGDGGHNFQNIDYGFDLSGNVLSITNHGTTKDIVQNFEYDDLYQLVGAEGEYNDNTIGGITRTNRYTQSYQYDRIGNMVNKTSWNRTHTGERPFLLNYNMNYTYDPEHPHRAVEIGDWKYRYDDNGNLIEKYQPGLAGSNPSLPPPDTGYSDDNPPPEIANNPLAGWSDEEFASRRGNQNGGEPEDIIQAEYKWDEENRLVEAVVGNISSRYLYNSEGERTVKYGDLGETIYADKMYQLASSVDPQVITKHIFMGATRIVSKLSHNKTNDRKYERKNTFYYHGDHLGSSNYITDYEGEEYEHLEYTPYGETWIEEGKDTLANLNYMFTGKEKDPETGLYYFGARYLDTRTSRWIGCDPLGPELANPGREGYSVLEGTNWYGYCSNNPINYSDPTGLEVKLTFYVTSILTNDQGGETAFGYIDGVDLDTGKTIHIADVFSGGQGGDGDYKYRSKSKYIPFGTYNILSPTDTGYRLEARDQKYGDDKADFKDGSKNRNSELRLHARGGGLTWGCISVDNSEFRGLNDMLKDTSTSESDVLSKFMNIFKRMKNPTETLKKYGEIEVVDARPLQKDQ